MNLHALLPAGLLAVAPAAVAPSSHRGFVQEREPLASPSAAAETAPADLGGVLEPIRAAGGLPALAGAVVEGGRLSGLGAVGLRAAGSDAAVTVDDLWHIGSCAKAMTATVIARLVERGKLRWTTTVGEALKRFEMDEAWKAVTLEELLAHRGGAPADIDPGTWLGLRLSRERPQEQRRALVESVLAEPPEQEPGTAFVYSNAGYAIAAAMAEAASQETWERLARKELFEPLLMESAGFGAPGVKGELTQPRGHQPGRGGPKPVEPGPTADNPQGLAPAGTVHMSMADWARFAALHLAGARGERRLLAPESFAKLHAPPQDQTYALGWGVGERGWAGGRVLTHAGSNTLWYAVVWIAPERDLAVLVATNAGGQGAAETCDQAASALIRWAQGEGGAGR